MSLNSPNLDDRRFNDLVNEAKRMIMTRCPDWTDMTVGDPGMVMVELFAHLTEVMIYRLNRVPDKAYVEFLRLIGVQLQPPSAASAELEFRLAKNRDKALEIPRGTRVAAARAGRSGQPPVFVTTTAVTIPAGQERVVARALHSELVQAEMAGHGTGLPGLSVTVSRPPLINPSGDDLDLVVGVEAVPEELDVNTPAIRHDGKTFRIWAECDNFSDQQPDSCVYSVDRCSGIINFAPAVQLLRSSANTLGEDATALAAVPPAGREIRLWYRRGGGVEGNVAASMLTVMKDSIVGVEVTNPAPAVGGRDAEQLDNALLRGPQELHSLQRAVTARDFELLAVSGSGAVNRAKVFTRAALWAHAEPGTIEVLLVPEIPEEARQDGYISHEVLCSHESGSERDNILRKIDGRRPLGVICRVNWAHYKPVSIEARVLVRREEDRESVGQRLRRSLHETITPMASPESGPGWPFGRSLKAWDVYKIIGSEPGVISVDDVKLVIDDAPTGEVRRVAADNYQSNTWYAVRGGTVFRSMNNGEGWESMVDFPGEEVELVACYLRTDSGPGRPGLLAVANRITETGGSCVRVSHDCGENWEVLRLIKDYHIDDMAWIDREGLPSLLWATDNGLYEHTLAKGAVPQKTIVDDAEPDMGFYAVVVSGSATGATYVAVAARQRGVYLSAQGGIVKSFMNIGLRDELVPVLAVQQLGPHRYLWAGLGVVGDDEGKGCCRWLLAEENPDSWIRFREGWEAGGCRSLAFKGDTVFAASQRLGALALDVNKQQLVWRAPDINCGLPVAEEGRLQQIEVVACDPEGDWLLAVSQGKGVFRSSDGGATFGECSKTSFQDEVTVPENWILCSGVHRITVDREDEG